MNVYQIRLKVYLLEDIQAREVQTKVTALIDRSFLNKEETSQMHESNMYKMYCHDFLYPIEKDQIYKKDNIYSITIRTIDDDLAKFFSEVLVHSHSNEMKALTAEIKIIPKRVINSIHTLTPAVMKSEKGYWRTKMPVSEFEERLKVNLIKKYNSFYGEKLDEDFQLYHGVEFFNNAPIPIRYKNITLLGDKVKLHISEHDTAQKLAYMSLGTGILEMNARGNGFVNYEWY